MLEMRIIVQGLLNINLMHYAKRDALTAQDVHLHMEGLTLPKVNKKSFFKRLFGIIDKKLEERSKSCCCCDECRDKNKKK